MIFKYTESGSPWAPASGPGSASSSSERGSGLSEEGSPLLFKRKGTP